MKHNLALFAILFFASHATLVAAEDEVRPDEIQFRRQAVVRMIFDSNQNIPLSSLRPAKVIELDLMHPERLPNPGVEWDFKQGSLSGASPKAGGASVRWVGGFNPFATYDLVIENATGDGAIGMTFLHSSNGDSLTASLQFKAGKPESHAETELDLRGALSLPRIPDQTLMTEGRHRIP